MTRNKTIYYRVKKNDHYTIVSNEISKNPNLSMGAKGLLLTAFSNSDDWFINREYLVNSSNKDGRTKVKSYMKEIEASGYARFSVERHDGEFCNIWEFFSNAIPLEQRSNKTNWRSKAGATHSQVLQKTCTTQELSTTINNNIQNNQYIEEDIVSGYGDEEEYQGEIRGLW
jgi:hypothetical protein